MFAWFGVLSLGVKIAIVAGLVLAFAGTVYAIQRAIFHWGYDAAVVELTPKITKANTERDNALKDLTEATKINAQYVAELTRLDVVVKEQTDSINKYRIAAVEAEIKVRKALVDIAVKEKKYTAEIARLLAIATGPVLTEGACEEADAILRGLMRDRVRDAGTPTPAG